MLRMYSKTFFDLICTMLCSCIFFFPTFEANLCQMTLDITFGADSEVMFTSISQMGRRSAFVTIVCLIKIIWNIFHKSFFLIKTDHQFLFFCISQYWYLKRCFCEVGQHLWPMFPSLQLLLSPFPPSIPSFPVVCFIFSVLRKPGQKIGFVVLSWDSH